MGWIEIGDNIGEDLFDDAFEILSQTELEDGPDELCSAPIDDEFTTIDRNILREPNKWTTSEFDMALARLIELNFYARHGRESPTSRLDRMWASKDNSGDPALWLETDILQLRSMIHDHISPPNYTEAGKKPFVVAIERFLDMFPPPVKPEPLSPTRRVSSLEVLYRDSCATCSAGSPNRDCSLFREEYRHQRTTAQILRFLVAEGAGVDGPVCTHSHAWITQAEPQTTPLAAAAASGELDAVRWLLDHGADIDSNASIGASLSPDYYLHTFTALHVASARGHVDIVRLLLARGANPNVVCSALAYYMRPTDLYYRTTNVCMPTPMDFVHCVTSLHLATEACAQLLLEAGAIISRDSNHRTPLHWAVVDGDFAKAKLFLDKGCPVDDTDRDGATGLALVCSSVEMGMKREYDWAEMATLLVDAGGDIGRVYPQDWSIHDRLWFVARDHPEFQEFFQRFSHLNAYKAREVAKGMDPKKQVLLAGGMTKTEHGWVWTETSVTVDKDSSTNGLELLGKYSVRPDLGFRNDMLPGMKGDMVSFL
jgi:hypothetical protein